ncbi:MAG: chromate efflux transporter [Paracoccaceae bacterium]
MTVAGLSRPEPQWPELWHCFGRIGVLSFGGPAAQIALMHRDLVDNRKWLTEQEYLRALSLCMLLPGPEAMQLATYAGWRLRGMAGGLLAGCLFVLPGALVILSLAAAYAVYGQLPLVSALFFGVKACVSVIVIEALLRVAKRALKGNVHRLIAVLAFVALFVFGLPFPLIIALAGLAGALLLTTPRADAISHPGHGHLLPVFAVGLGLWGLPLAWLWFTGRQFLWEIGLFFSKLAMVTFGGAYAVLAYMTQEVVQDHGWLTTPQMMDALGLAETTPGPLILVTEFVAFVAGYRVEGAGVAIAAAALTIWVTFVPCFLWIFAFAPYVEWIATRPRLQGALSGITAAVVGVIGNLALWFAVHVLFRDVSHSANDWLAVPMPDIRSLDWRALLILLLSSVALLRFHAPLWLALGGSAILGALLAQFV